MRLPLCWCYETRSEQFWHSAAVKLAAKMMKLPCNSIAQKTARLNTKPWKQVQVAPKTLLGPQGVAAIWTSAVLTWPFNSKGQLRMTFWRWEAGDYTQYSFLDKFGNIVGDSSVPCVKLSGKAADSCAATKSNLWADLAFLPLCTGLFRHKTSRNFVSVSNHKAWNDLYHQQQNQDITIINHDKRICL